MGRRSLGLAPLALAASALLAGAASSTSPPPPLPHARYGPLVQCLGGYAVAVAPSEAVYVMEGGISLVTPAYLINLSLDDRDPYRQQTRTGEFEDPRLGHIVRYQRGDGDSRRIENWLAPADGERAVIVRSGAGEEQRALARIARASPERGECGDFTAPDFPGEDPDAYWWAPPLIPGPLYRCENRIGYALRDGEALRMPWPIWTDRSPARAVLPDARLSVRGPYRTPAGPAPGPTAAGYLASVQQDYVGPHVLLSAPRPLVRRQRPREARGDYEIRIYFAPGNEADARAFASRLEFVESGDPRCNPDPERR